MQILYGDENLFYIFFLFIIEKSDFLELRQNKNNSDQLERIPRLKLPRFFNSGVESSALNPFSATAQSGSMGSQPKNRFSGM